MGAKASTPATAKSLAFVTSIVSSNNVAVFSKEFCPYCRDVVKLLTDLEVKHKLVQLDHLEQGDEVQNALQEITGQRTVPNVFIGGTSIGGCDETYEMHKKGQLLPLVNKQ